jgi:predicted PurR-regulated permease PerM
VLEIDYPVALAMVVFLTGLIPLIGATIGAVVLTIVACSARCRRHRRRGVVPDLPAARELPALPAHHAALVDVSPAATVVAVLIGGSLLGVLGALLAIPIAAAVQLVGAGGARPRQDQS